MFKFLIRSFSRNLESQILKKLCFRCDGLEETFISYLTLLIFVNDRFYGRIYYKCDIRYVKKQFLIKNLFSKQED